MENSVIEILMRRDELTRQEAEESIAEVRELMIENPYDADEILMDELGLEMDYLLDILDFENYKKFIKHIDILLTV